MASSVIFKQTLLLNISNLNKRAVVKVFSSNPVPHKNEPNHGSTMAAWQIHAYGDLKEVQLSTSTRVPMLTSPKDVLVKVTAASINPLDVLMLGGYGNSVLNCMRETDSLCRGPTKTPEFPLTLGRDFSGEVVECGLGVHDLRPGDKVWGVTPPHHQGSHSEFVLATADTVCRCPENVNLVDAASLPFAGLTAWSSLWISAGLCVWPTQGRRVLLLGGSGGVGTLALQILKAWGAQVVTTCSTDAEPLLDSLGADVVIDYTKPDAGKLIKEEGPYDIILNTSGIPDTPHIEYLKEWRFSRYVTVSPPLLRNTDQHGILAGTVKNAFDLIAPNLQSISAKGATVRWAFFVPSKLGLKQLTELTTAGKITPVIDRKFLFSEIPAAYQRQLDGHLRGKVVVQMDSTNHPS